MQSLGVHQLCVSTELLQTFLLGWPCAHYRGTGWGVITAAGWQQDWAAWQLRLCSASDTGQVDSPNSEQFALVASVVQVADGQSLLMVACMWHVALGGGGT